MKPSLCTFTRQFVSSDRSGMTCYFLSYFTSIKQYYGKILIKSKESQICLEKFLAKLRCFSYYFLLILGMVLNIPTQRNVCHKIFLLEQLQVTQQPVHVNSCWVGKKRSVKSKKSVICLSFFLFFQTLLKGILLFHSYNVETMKRMHEDLNRSLDKRLSNYK